MNTTRVMIYKRLPIVKEILKKVFDVFPYDDWGIGDGTMEDQIFKERWEEWVLKSPNIVSDVEYRVYFYFKSPSDAILFKLRCL